MTTFQVGHQVRIKENAKFRMPSIRKSFEAANRLGKIVEIDPPDTLWMFPILVQTESGANEHFKADELELIEDQG